MKRLLNWLKSLNWAALRRNGKTTFLGIVAFISYLAAQESQILPFLPERYRDAAKAVFAASLLLMGYFSTDRPRSKIYPLPPDIPASSTPPDSDA